MKIKRITITGMHKVAHQSYDINDGITYFVGPNGAGKSTVLEAIELALLGYIPGYGKTNESVMKHASGPVMAVVMDLDDGTTITRTWTRSGSSVSAKVAVTGAVTGGPEIISSLISEIELPIFNFNEFKSMTANKLKEWFIAFLPSDASKIDLGSHLKSEAIAKGLPYDDPLASAEIFIKNQHVKGVELVKALNDYFKSEQSYVKGQIAKLQGTVESLIRYEDAIDVDEEALNKEILNKHIEIENLVAYEATKQVQDRLVANLAAAKANLLADSFDADPRIPELKEKESRLWTEIEVLMNDNKDIQSAINSLIAEKAALPTANATCPYTKQTCETAAKLANDAKARAEEIDKQIKFKQEEAEDCSPAKINELSKNARAISDQISQIESAYNAVTALEAQITDIGAAPSAKSVTDLRAEISTIEELLRKAAANKQYDALTATVTNDKFKLENELELLKAWTKLTDANGLQSSLMNKPFEDLEKDMSSYLSVMFGEPVEAKFNLVSKANSFSFGLNRGDQYIEFDYLSSGERCLFTLALILCILNRSSSKIKTIIIDDILDHLDETNATHLFDALKNVTDTQFILAGVQECKDQSICIKI